MIECWDGLTFYGFKDFTYFRCFFIFKLSYRNHFGLYVKIRQISGKIFKIFFISAIPGNLRAHRGQNVALLRGDGRRPSTHRAPEQARRPAGNLHGLGQRRVPEKIERLPGPHQTCMNFWILKNIFLKFNYIFNKIKKNYFLFSRIFYLSFWIGFL